MKWLLLAVFVAACGDPPAVHIKYKLAAGPDQRCMDSNLAPASTCSDVAMPCASHLSVRIISPDDPTQAFVSICEPVPPTSRQDLCSIAAVNLPDGISIPEQNLLVEVAIYADRDLKKDAAGNFLCNPDPQFTPGGLPKNEVPPNEAPIAIGGSAYYRPGDSETVVSLGCTKQDELAECMVDTGLQVSATVNDFDTPLVAVTNPGIVPNLILRVGEPLPTINPGDFVLNPNTTTVLDQTQSQPIPAWTQSIPNPIFMTSACVELLEEDTPEITPYLTCNGAFMPGQKSLDFTAIRVSPTTRDQILGALKLTQPPANGLVIGMVVDSTGAPAAGITVTALNNATTYFAEYLTADRKGLQAGSTSASGIFVFLDNGMPPPNNTNDAQYGSTFSGRGTTTLQTTLPGPFGGRVDGKVTVVVLQLPHL